MIISIGRRERKMNERNDNNLIDVDTADGFILFREGLIKFA